MYNLHALGTRFSVHRHAAMKAVRLGRSKSRAIVGGEGSLFVLGPISALHTSNWSPHGDTPDGMQALLPSPLLPPTEDLERNLMKGGQMI